MSRRTSLPGAAELFRTTSPTAPSSEAAAALAAEPEPSSLAVAAVAAVPAAETLDAPGPVPASLGAAPSAAAASLGTPPSAAPGRSVRQTGRRIRPAAERMPSGRERHEEKITVYCSAEELVDLESARLALRAEQGLAVDRGRIVREAIAVVLADFEAKGDASILVRRLRDA